MVGVLSAALLGRSGIPGLAAVVFLAVILIAMACWVISSKDRSMNLSRILFARRGDARFLDPDPSGRTTGKASRGPGPRRKRPSQVPTHSV
jgi:hypothetical protein